MDATGNPRLTDFGISMVIDQIYTDSRFAIPFPQTTNRRFVVKPYQSDFSFILRPPDVKWSAPEILNANVVHATPASDVYSFALVVVEVGLPIDLCIDLT